MFFLDQTGVMGFGKACFSWALYQEVYKSIIVIREDISPRIQRTLINGQLLAYVIEIFQRHWLQLTRVLKLSHGRLAAEVNKEMAIIFFLDTVLDMSPCIFTCVT